VFAVESLIDEAAAELNIDPVEFRLNNCLKPHDQLPTGQYLHPDKIPANLEILIRDVGKRAGYERKKEEYSQFNTEHTDEKRGIGIAITLRGTGLGGEGIDTAGAAVTVEPDGSVISKAD